MITVRLNNTTPVKHNTGIYTYWHNPKMPE